MNREVKFDYDLLDLNKVNINEKIIPYVNELIASLLGNECKNVRVMTRIKKLTDNEVQVYMTLEEMNKGLKKQKGK